jgi:predicted MFS family arabinose efflux permease
MPQSSRTAIYILVAMALVIGVPAGVVLGSVWVPIICLLGVGASVLLARWFMRRIGLDREIERLERVRASERGGEDR